MRVEGEVEFLRNEESQRYYDLRARGSRIGAWASRQSAVLEPEDGKGDEGDGRQVLEGWVKEVEERFDGKEDIPCPKFWGGLRVIPRRVEFWQGRDSRLHDRFVYVNVGESGRTEAENGVEREWKIERLSP